MSKRMISMACIVWWIILPLNYLWFSLLALPSNAMGRFITRSKNANVYFCTVAAVLRRLKSLNISTAIRHPAPAHLHCYFSWVCPFHPSFPLIKGTEPWQNGSTLVRATGTKNTKCPIMSLFLAQLCLGPFGPITTLEKRTVERHFPHDRVRR